MQWTAEPHLEAYFVDPAELSFYICSQWGPVWAVEAEGREEGVVGPAVQGPVPEEKWRERERESKTYHTRESAVRGRSRETRKLL